MIFITLMIIGQVNFEPERRFGVANGMTDFVCADLDGQNGPDIIAASEGDQALIMLWNRGVVDGVWRGFTPPRQIPTQDAPLALDVCDFDLDGDLDVIAGTPTGITRWVNDGHGNLGGEESSDGGGYRNFVRVFCGVSGFPDVMRFADGGWTVFRSRPDGTFALTGVARIGGTLGDASLCDIDGDGTDDIIRKVSGDAFFVNLSTGRGSFAPRILYGDASGAGSTSVACSDLDGDGPPDVLTGRLTRFRGRLDGTLVPSGPLSDGFRDVATRIAIADLDLDGDDEVVTISGGGVEVFTNDGAGNFGFPAAFDPRSQSILHTCDIDGDGDIDIITGTSTQISVLLNTTLTTEPLLGDVDGDGDVDLADYLVLEACLEGAGREPFFAECDAFDFDNDNDVDLADLVAFQAAFTGAR